LWRRDNRIVIYYNGDHAKGVVENWVLDSNAPPRKKSREDLDKYLPLEDCHYKETLAKVFNLDEKDTLTLKEYYDHLRFSSRD